MPVHKIKHINLWGGIVPVSVFCSLVIIVSCSPILSQQKQIKLPTAVVAQPSAAPEEAPTAMPAKKITPVSGVVQNSDLPGEPQGQAQIIYDQTCDGTAAEKRAPGGDEYSNGRFERPFDKDMNYLPALDISRAELVRSADGWNFFSLFLEAAPASPPAVYGIELDLNIDGRGDYLIQVLAPAAHEWGESGVKMWWDSDGDVGGRVINRSDPKGFRGSGFESLKIDASASKNTGKIWTRLTASGIQVAVKDELLGGSGAKFTWKPYADGNPFPPSQYDLNDYYLLPAAGSPLIGERDYPLKAVYAIDNTCRGLSGLTPSGSEQGVCPP